MGGWVSRLGEKGSLRFTDKERDSTGLEEFRQEYCVCLCFVLRRILFKIN